MAYLEIWKSGTLIARRRVDEQKARRGCRIRLGSAGEAHLAIGQSQKIGKYDVRMFEGEPPEAPGRVEEAVSKPQGEVKAPLPLDFSVGAPTPSADETGLPPDVEGYKIIKRLGQGGMGTVWRSEQLSTRREVALKLMASTRFDSAKAQARFEREVELTARLDHPNIASVYDSGLHHGMYYYAMEFVDGMPLDQYVDEKNLSDNQILALMRTVCEAIEHAHLRGVMHRDLKPSNIMVGFDGQPHVVDFGLARTFLDEDEAMTVSIEGEVAGTPAYMSPEQAAGHHDQIDTRTDVYSLGLILYRLLTGQSPYDLSGSLFDVLQRVVQGRMRRPREITKSIDRELESLLLKALAHDQEDRYPSAGMLADDIGNYLDCEPLYARVPTTMYFLGKKVRKYRVQVGIGLALFIILLSIILAAYAEVIGERTRRRLAEEETKIKDIAIEYKNKKLTWAELELKVLGEDKDEARAALRVMGDRLVQSQEEFQQLAEGKLQLPPRVRHGDLEEGGVLSPKALVQGPALPQGVNSWTLETVAHRGPVFELLGSPDGRALASVGVDHTLRMWDMEEDMRLEAVFVTGSHIQSTAWSLDGSFLMAGHRGQTTRVTVWDKQMQERTRTVALGSPDAYFIKLSSLAQYAAVPLADANTVQIWDLDREDVLTTLSNHDAQPGEMVWSAQDRYLAMLATNGAVKVWDISDSSQVYVNIDPNQPATALAWVPNRDQLTLARNGHIDLLDIPSGSLAKSIPLPFSTPVDDLAWSPTGKMLSLLIDRRALFLDRASGAVQSLHVPSVTAQTWVGRHLVLSDGHGSLHCVDPSSGKIVQRQISRWCGPIQKVRVSPSGDYVAQLSGNGMLSVWNMYTWEPVAHMDAKVAIPDDPPSGGVLLWSPSGDELVYTDPSGTALVFRDSHSLYKTRTLTIAEARITCGGRSEAGLMALGTEEGDIYISQWSQSKPLSKLTGHQGPVTAVAWLASPDRIVSAGQDKTVRFWDVLTGQCTRTLTGYQAAVSDLVLSPDQKTLASIDPNQDVMLWDASLGAQVQHLVDDGPDPLRRKGTLTAAWSPDGTMLADADQGGRIRIWNPTENKVLLRCNTLGQGILSIAWSPDNRYLLAGATDGTTRVWDVFNDLCGHVLLLPLSGRPAPGIAVSNEGDYRGPPGIDRDLRYVVDSEKGFHTWHANEFYVAHGWANEPWQVGLFQPGEEEIQRIYVKADAQRPSSDGLTWESAFSDLQVALSLATEGTEIWVAQGTYLPDRDKGSREASFELRNGIRVYGGFVGNETNVHQRNPQKYLTTLSGDLLGNDLALTNNDENSYHVVVIERSPNEATSQGVLLDGFTISGGNASETRKNTQAQKRNRLGGGALIHGDQVTLQSCVFVNNAASEAGGGIFLGGNEDMVRDCRFVKNVSGMLGGGLSLRARASKVSRCVFEDNHATSGGGLDLSADNSAMVDCQFIMNWAEKGGAVFGGQEEGISFVFCSFYGNRATDSGGAWCQHYTWAMRAQNCLFVNNSAGKSGGALCSHGYRGRAHLEGCGFVGNTAVRWGGAMTYTDSKITAVNCSFINNTISGDPRDQGFVGGIYHNVRDPNNDTALVLSNCILWGNTDHRERGVKAQFQALNTQINNCCIQGWTGRLGGSHNRGDDPLFTDLRGPDGVLGTLDDDLRLSPASPCIDRGDKGFLGLDVADMDHDEGVAEPIPLDLCQQPRVLGSTVDIGACEAR